MKDPLTILIAGCGDVGGLLGVKLALQGHRVWGMLRNPSRLPPGLLPLEADLNEQGLAAKLPQSLDFVFFTAAASRHDEAGYRETYLLGLDRLLTALKERGMKQIRRVFFTSSTGVYGQTDGSWVDEASPTEPQGFSGKAMLEAERLLFDSGFPACAVRFGGIYGPGRTRLLSLAAAGALCAPSPPLYTNRIHREDCAGVLLHLMGLTDLDELYLAVDDEPAAKYDVLFWLAAQIGAPPPKAGAAAPTSKGSSPNKRCANRKLKATGFRFRYPSFREGYRELADAFQGPFSG